MAPKHYISDDDEDGEGPSSCSVAIDNFLKRRHPDSKSTNPFDNMSGLAIRQKKPRLDLPVNAAGSAKLHDPVTEPDNSSSSSHDSSAILASSQQSSSSQCSPSSFRPFRTLLEFYNDIGARRWSCGNRRLLPEVEHEPYLDWNVRRMKFPDWETELKWITRGHLHEMTFEVLVDRLGFNTFLRSVDKHYRDIGVRRLGTEAMVAAWYATVLWKFREWEFSLKERGIAQDRSDERCRDDLLRDAVLQPFLRRYEINWREWK